MATIVHSTTSKKQAVHASSHKNDATFLFKTLFLNFFQTFLTKIA
jgi:hypothetical protein